MPSNLRRAHTRVIHVEVTAEDAPEDTLKCGHPAALDRARHEFKIEAGDALAGQGAVLGGMLEQGRRAVAVIERRPDLRVSVFGLVEETGRLAQDTPLLFELGLALAEFLPRSVHLHQPLLVLLELTVQLVERVLRPRPSHRERRDGRQRRHAQRRLQRGDLRVK